MSCCRSMLSRKIVSQAAKFVLTLMSRFILREIWWLGMELHVFASMGDALVSEHSEPIGNETSCILPNSRRVHLSYLLYMYYAVQHMRESKTRQLGPRFITMMHNEPFVKI